MVRGGWLGILLVFPVLALLVPGVSATLTMNCPASAQATHPFTISATDRCQGTLSAPAEKDGGEEAGGEDRRG